MTGPFFVDTNVLFYADDPRSPSKRLEARKLLRHAFSSRHGVLSPQVLREFFAAATRKLALDAEAARRRVELYSKLDVVPETTDDLLQAIDLHRLHQLSLWDALIVTAAKKAGCTVLYTEDLQDGQRFGDLEVRNPFDTSEVNESGI